MAVSIDWATKIISVPKTDLTLVSGVVYEYDLTDFRLELKSLEDDEEGMPFLDTHIHNVEVTLAGATYASTIEIVNGYTVTVEDGQYAVNFYGANSNIMDVTNVNQVSIRTANSAGLIEVATGSGPTAGEIADAVLDEAVADHNTNGSLGSFIRKILWGSR